MNTAQIEIQMIAALTAAACALPGSATGRTGTGLHESVTLAGFSPVIHRTLRRLAREAREVWKVENAARGCAELGVSEAELCAANNGMAEG